MQTIQLENSILEVDFKGKLSPRQEEVTAYRLSGKNKEAIAIILGSSPQTIKKHQQDAYQKMGVTGTDNPLAVLTLKAFMNNWVRLISMALIVFSIMPAPRINARSPRTPPARTASRTSHTIRTEVA